MSVGFNEVTRESVHLQQPPAVAGTGMVWDDNPMLEERIGGEVEKSHAVSECRNAAQY